MLFFKVLGAIVLDFIVAFCIAPLGFPYFPVAYYQAIRDCLKGKLPATKHEKTVPPEPAFIGYFFKKARQDLYDIIRAGYARSRSILDAVEERIDQRLDETIQDVFNVGSVLVQAVFVAGIIVPFTVIVIIHHVIVFFVCLSVYLIAPFFRLAEAVAKAYRSITYICPRCYHKIGLLYYHCDKCGAIHKKLVPGSYGLIRRRCKCNHKIPTFDLVGRSKLPKSCPACGFHIMGDDAKTFHVALIGGVSTGKTSYMMSAISAYIEDARNNGITAVFPYKDDKDRFKGWQTSSKAGKKPAKTQERTPKAIVLQVTEKSGYKHNVYLYDSAGELYSGEESRLSVSGFLRLSQGIVFIIDPFSIPPVRAKTKKKILLGAAPSYEEPSNILERLIDYSDRQGLGQSWRKVPVFVVVNKIDAIDKTIMPGSDIKQWLIVNGLGSFDVKLHNYFDNVSYYAVSSLGCNADGVTPFKPIGVLKPLKDMLKKSRIEDSDQSIMKGHLRSQRIATSLGFITSTLALALCVFLLGFAIFHAVSYFKSVSATTRTTAKPATVAVQETTPPTTPPVTPDTEIPLILSPESIDTSFSPPVISSKYLAVNVPVIDGVLSSGEWSEPSFTTDFVYSYKGMEKNGYISGYFINNDNDFYIAVRVFADDFKKEILDKENAYLKLTLLFDEKNDGVLFNGDDVKWFWDDEYFDISREGGGYIVDTIKNGEGVCTYSNMDTSYTYELRLPLNSGDNKDFKLKAGDKIGVALILSVIQEDEIIRHTIGSVVWPSILSQDDASKYSTIMLAVNPNTVRR